MTILFYLMVFIELQNQYWDRKLGIQNIQSFLNNTENNNNNNNHNANIKNNKNIKNKEKLNDKDLEEIDNQKFKKIIR